MLNQVEFEKCIRANLKDRQFGKKRADEIIEDFRVRTEFYRTDGKSEVDASILAMSDTFENLSKQASEKAKRTAKMLSVQAQNFDRVKQALDVNTALFAKKGEVKGSRGKALGKALISLIEHDPRFVGGSYSGLKEVVRGQLFAVMDDVIDKAGKGAFGVQKGKAHLPNIVREVLGEETGDKAAKELAKGWMKTNALGVDLFNEAGGSLAKLDRYLPDPMTSTAKMAGADLRGKLKKKVTSQDVKAEAFNKFRKIALDHWDWDRMRWPDGTRIDIKEREAVIDNVYRTKALDGANKIDDKSFRGQGRALGNMIEEHRFVHYKDAEGWLKAHEEFGDGNVFDVMVRHVEDMSHRVAMVETFGPNPDLAANNAKAIAKKVAADNLDDAEVKALDGVLKNDFDPMMELISRANPMDPESIMGNAGVSLANVLTGAQLGSASLLAIPGDTMQTLATRAANNIPLFGGIDFYFKSILTDPKFANDISTQSGFIADDLISSVYATTRYTGINTVGPAASRRVSDLVMRASLMSGHTKSARRAVQLEFMGMMNRDAGKKFNDLPYAAMMQRYGITEELWDGFRKGVKPHSPKKGINFLRPIDALNTDIPNKTELYRKFQEMIIEEAKTGVPEATIGAAKTLRGTERPDTLRGLLLHSFSMYKNFPVSFVSIYGRLGMVSPNVKGRLGFYAGLGVGMSMVGAMGVQMREVSKGRDPLPMDDPRFWGKAFLAGGAMSLWGDFLFAGVNQYGTGPEALVGGPMAGFVGDTTTLLLGDSVSWVQAMSGDEVFDAKFPERFVNYMKRYTPGSSIWWSRLALERQVWDRLEEVADPKAYQKRRRKMRRQEKEFGNEYYWPMGERSPARPPQYEGQN